MLNLGTLQANGPQHGGWVKVKASAAAVNTGNVLANATNGDGGYLRFHGDGFSLNAASGLLSATGSGQGGTVVLTSGNSAGPAQAVSANVVALLGTDPLLAFATTGLTPPLTTIGLSLDPTVRATAANAGAIDARGVQEGGGGRIYLAGNNQAGILQGGSLNGLSVDVSGVLAASDPNAAFQSSFQQLNDAHTYLLAGRQITNSAGEVMSAVALAACDAAPNHLEPDANSADPSRQGSEFPDDFVLPTDTVTGPPLGPDGGGTRRASTSSNEDPDINLLGLFQQNRPLDIPEGEYRLVLRLNDPGSFLASAYLPVTEEILALALGEYHRHVSNGDRVEEALRHARLYLEEAGVTKEVAAALNEAVQNGTLTASLPIQQMLDTISTAPATSETTLPTTEIQQ